MYRHLFERTRAALPPLDAERAGWDNGGRAEFQRTRVGATAECRRLCRADRRCFQYKVDRGTCVLREAFDVGSALPAGGADEGRVPPSWQDQVFSGWNMDHVDAWAREHTCQTVEWVRPSVQRMY